MMQRRYTYSKDRTVRCRKLCKTIRLTEVKRGGKWRMYGTIWEDKDKAGGDTLTGVLDGISASNFPLDNGGRIV